MMAVPQVGQNCINISSWTGQNRMSDLVREVLLPKCVSGQIGLVALDDLEGIGARGEDPEIAFLGADATVAFEADSDLRDLQLEDEGLAVAIASVRLDSRRGGRIGRHCCWAGRSAGIVQFKPRTRLCDGVSLSRNEGGEILEG
jgi:hypothetical protein